MANNKTGFDFYQADTDRHQDIKIKRLKRNFGCDGYAVYEYILTEIFRLKGCFIKWDENTALDVADYWRLKESTVTEIVNYCCSVGLFDKELLKSESILTSEAIQLRYIEMCKRAKRAHFKIPKNYMILPEESAKLPEECGDSSEECGDSSEECAQNSEVSPHSIVKYSKGKNSKVKEKKVVEVSDAPVVAPTAPKKDSAIEKFELRKTAFKESLFPFTQAPPKYNGSYSKEMVKNFFDYWSEPNKSKSRMRWEQETTWDLSLRLSNWAKRENNFNKNSPPVTVSKFDKANDSNDDFKQRFKESLNGNH